MRKVTAKIIEFLWVEVRFSLPESVRGNEYFEEHFRFWVEGLKCGVNVGYRV